MSEYIKQNYERGTGGGLKLSEMSNKNPHAVALGKMTSEAKAKASEKNGRLGGRPKGS